VFSRRLNHTDLIELCRSLRYSLTSGMMLRNAVELIATKGTRRLRPIGARIAAGLRGGWGLEQALSKLPGVFPPLFLSLVSVGEESGQLPEVLGEVEKYYQLQAKLRRDFIGEIAWPIFQFFFAILVVALVIYITGVVAPAPRLGEPPFDALGLGLRGEDGALTFLAVVGGSLALLAVTYLLLKRLLRRRAIVERVLLLVPLIGSCLGAMAMTRFCLALRLMLETNLSVMKMLRLALQATDNQVYIAAAPQVESSLRRGNSIASSLAAPRVFPDDFISVLTVAEDTGRLTEMLQIQGDAYDDLARRRLVLINRVASWLIWLSIAGFIVVVIVRIFLNAYLGQIERYLGP
jgi:type IV pilus assembly protein PilC